MKKLKFIKWMFAILLLLGIGAGIIAAPIVKDGYHMYQEAVREASLSDKVEEIRDKENYTSLEELPKIYLDAVLAVEDHRFYRHGGFDIIATLRALINDIRAMSFVEGGSTISQQLAKNLYFTQEKELTRKVAEVFMSFSIEKNYTKDEILELYLNSIYFGDGYYCVWDASQGYFGKAPKDMDAYESTLLAGIPNAPSAYAPTKSPQLARERQMQVLKKMVKRDFITQDEAVQIAEKEIGS